VVAKVKKKRNSRPCREPNSGLPDHSLVNTLTELSRPFCNHVCFQVRCDEELI